MVTSNADRRFILAKERMESFSNEELQRILDNVDIMCYDTFNYDKDTKTFCPVAIAMNLHNIIENPTDIVIKQEMAKRFTPTNIFKGTKGKFYTETRKEDILGLCTEILKKRNEN